MGSNPIQQHFLPACYLRNFQDEDVQLWMELKQPKIGIRYGFVKDNAQGFEELVAAIEAYFTEN